MSKSLTCFVRAGKQAVEIANHLKIGGFQSREVSVLRAVNGTRTVEWSANAPTDPAVPAGDALQASLGWLVGWTELTIAGIGGVAGNGMLLDAVRAASRLGSLRDTFVSWGMSGPDADRYEIRIRRQDILIAVRCANAAVAQLATVVCENFGAEDFQHVIFPESLE
jgi:hypothetical protein